MPDAANPSRPSSDRHLALPAIQALAAPEMAAMDTLIRQRLASDVVLINQIAEYIIGAGGKRLRPMLLLLAAGALGHRGADAHQLAAVVEFIHTSTLLHDDVVDESDLRRGRKTAILFAAATRLGALLAGADATTCDALHRYGLALGYAFQIADDVLDYASDAATLGKNLGDDLAEGKMTLPLIHAMAHSGDAVRVELRRIVEHGDLDGLPTVQAAIAACRSLDYSRERALQYARDAEASLSALPENAFVAALHGLAQYSVSRDH